MLRQGFCIVFNGGHTLRACIRNAMLELDRMVIVEGVIKKLAHLSKDGHSTDHTQNICCDLQDEFGDRLVIVQRAGYWLDKLEMCNSALPYLLEEENSVLWQFDCDEFYFPEAMRAVNNYAAENRHVTDFEFWGYHFYGNFDHHMPIGRGAWGNTPPWRRCFRWDGLPWVSHAPPHLLHGISTTQPEIMDRNDTYVLGAELYHYGYIWRDRVAEKFALHGANQYGLSLDGFDAFQKDGVWIDKMPLVPIKFTGKHPVDVTKFE